MTMRNLSLRLVWALLFFAAPLSAVDLTIVSKVTMGDSVSDSTTYLTSEYSRSHSGQNDSIMHFPTGKMTMIDHGKKEYWETSLEEMTAYWKKLTREMKGTPMEAMFGFGEEVEVEKLPGKRSFAGYDCQRYSLSLGDVLEVDLWASTSLEPPARYFDGRKLAAAAMGPMGQLFEKLYDELKKIKGFPLSTAVILRTPMSRTQTLDEAVEVKKGPIPASTFAVPSGYKKKKSPFTK
jgi:Domain of unknown function (DUF4412)